MTDHTAKELIQQVEAAMETMRPFLEADGGDMELVEITEDMVVRVKLLGACKECHMSAMTLKAGVEDTIRRSVPQITAVEAVEH